MIDEVLQLEKEDKNQAALQASHRAPVGSCSNAPAKGNEGKGNGDKKKGKGKGKPKEGGQGKRGELWQIIWPFHPQGRSRHHP